MYRISPVMLEVNVDHGRAETSNIDFFEQNSEKVLTVSEFMSE